LFRGNILFDKINEYNFTSAFQMRKDFRGNNFALFIRELQTFVLKGSFPASLKATMESQDNGQELKSRTFVLNKVFVPAP